MTPVHYLEIKTPKGVFLNGLWWGPKRAKRVVIMLHGLTGSAFSMRRVVAALAAKDTAVLTVNTRGFGEINSLKQKKQNRDSYLLAGTAHEIFTDCIDDINGAIRVAKKNAKEIYLAGHSTGCQKAMYWASKRNDSRVKGIILFGPLSDYSGALKSKGKKHLEKSVDYARRLVSRGKVHELMPKPFGEWFACDAQRFVSLYSSESPEEIFSYARPKRFPETLHRVKKPVLVLLAGKDEYGDTSPEKIQDWFAEHLKVGDEIAIIPKVGHSFKGGEKQVAKLVRSFMKDC